MFAIAIHFIGTLYYRLTFCSIKYLMSNFIIKMKHSEKSHFLYREYLRVVFDPMTRGHPQGKGYCDPLEGQVGSGSKK